jgi:hypothetical protein
MKDVTPSSLLRLGGWLDGWLVGGRVWLPSSARFLDECRQPSPAPAHHTPTTSERAHAENEPKIEFAMLQGSVVSE